MTDDPAFRPETLSTAVQPDSGAAFDVESGLEQFIAFGESLSPEIGPMFGRDAARYGRDLDRLRSHVRALEDVVEVARRHRRLALKPDAGAELDRRLARLDGEERT